MSIWRRKQFNASEWVLLVVLITAWLPLYLFRISEFPGRLRHDQLILRNGGFNSMCAVQIPELYWSKRVVCSRYVSCWRFVAVWFLQSSCVGRFALAPGSWYTRRRANSLFPALWDQSEYKLPLQMQHPYHPSDNLRMQLAWNFVSLMRRHLHESLTLTNLRQTSWIWITMKLHDNNRLK